MSNKYTLPAMPPSNQSFWKDAEVHVIEDTPPVKCEHKFIGVPEGARCKICHIGLLGRIDVQDEKLFHNGQQIEL